ncbi:MAG: hypothetical protein AAF939_02365 [Planctomycetota bacterium]
MTGRESIPKYRFIYFNPQTQRYFPTNIIAIDLGKFNSMFCFYNTATNEYSTALAATDRGYFESVLKSHQPDSVVVEACGPIGWVSDLCGKLNLKIIVCSTHEVV